MALTLAEQLGEAERKRVKQLMSEGHSEDFSKLLWGYGFTCFARNLGKYPRQSFLSFVMEQSKMLREKDPERADKLDVEFLKYLEKSIENKKLEEDDAN